MGSLRPTCSHWLRNLRLESRDVEYASFIFWWKYKFSPKFLPLVTHLSSICHRNWVMLSLKTCATCPGKGGPWWRSTQMEKEWLLTWGGSEVGQSAGGQTKTWVLAQRMTCCMTKVRLPYLSLRFLICANPNSPYEGNCYEDHRI